MADKVSREQRSTIMSHVRSVNTSPEIEVRRALHKAGFRFRIHATVLSGKPDIVLPRYKTVIMVHGCLWHWHGCARSRMPSSNVAYWRRKLERNVKRDASNARALRTAGWDVEVVWECELLERTGALVKRLADMRIAERERRLVEESVKGKKV